MVNNNIIHSYVKVHVQRYIEIKEKLENENDKNILGKNNEVRNFQISKSINGYG